MDIFQGWFKDRTDNPVDFRSFSAFYMLLRLLFAFVIVVIILNVGRVFTKTFYWSIELLHVTLGALFLVLKLYKKNWMNHTDGLILLLLGTMMLTIHFDPKFTFILAIVIAMLVIVSVSLYFFSKCVKRCCV